MNLVMLRNNVVKFQYKNSKKKLSQYLIIHITIKINFTLLKSTFYAFNYHQTTLLCTLKSYLTKSRRHLGHDASIFILVASLFSIY